MQEFIAQEYLRTCEDLFFSKTSGGLIFFHDCVKFIAIYHCFNAGKIERYICIYKNSHAQKEVQIAVMISLICFQFPIGQGLRNINVSIHKPDLGVVDLFLLIVKSADVRLEKRKKAVYPHLGKKSTLHFMQSFKKSMRPSSPVSSFFEYSMSIFLSDRPRVCLFVRLSFDASDAPWTCVLQSAGYYQPGALSS